MQRIVILLCLFIHLFSRNCFGMLESNEIDKLLKDKQPVIFHVTNACQEKCTKDAVEQGNGIKQLFALTTCRISNSAPSPDPPRVMLHDDEEENALIGKPSSPTDLRFRAMFLKQYPNTVSYMILNPNNAHWFFTNELSGCDIFIATNDAQPNMPMVLHANLNGLSDPEDQVSNLRWKGDKVDVILSELQTDYALKVRLYITPEDPISPNYDQYWQSYKDSNQGVKLAAMSLPLCSSMDITKMVGNFLSKQEVPALRQIFGISLNPSL